MPRLCRALPLTVLLLAGAGAAHAQSSSTRFAGAPRIGSSDSWSLKPRGRVQYDLGGVDVPDGVNAPGIGFENNLRRARLGIEGTAPGGFTYVVEGELSAGIFEFIDANIGYKASDNLTFTVGQHNNFQSLEELTSSRFISTIERAAFTDAFNFQRRLGVSATFTADDLTVQAGLFGQNILEIGEANGGHGLDGRIVYAPELGKARLHFGASAHWRDTDDAAEAGITSRYRQRPLIGITDVRFVATPTLPVSSEIHYGLEAAVIRGPIHAVAEAHWLNADVTTGPDRKFFGGYAEIGWFVTGETRRYRGARWDRTQVREGGAIEEGGYGAIQLNLRYDYLDLNSGPTIGGRQNGIIASVIWIPTDHLRFTANYARLNYDDARLPATGGDRSYGVNVWGVRGQFDF